MANDIGTRTWPDATQNTDWNSVTSYCGYDCSASLRVDKDTIRLHFSTLHNMLDSERERNQIKGPAYFIEKCTLVGRCHAACRPDITFARMQIRNTLVYVRKLNHLTTVLLHLMTVYRMSRWVPF